MNPSLIQALCDAFPEGYFSCPGTRTVGGQTCISLPDRSLIWFWPDGRHFSKPGMSQFDDDRKKLLLLPDIKDRLTLEALRIRLAQLVGLDSKSGILWYPKGSKSRGARPKKRLDGWCMSSKNRVVFFPLPDEPNSSQALCQCIARCRCKCGKGDREGCPQHDKGKWWR